MSSKNEAVSRLSQSSFFTDIPEKILQEFAMIVEERVIPAHTIVFQQGDRAGSFYIIDSGNVRYWLTHGNQKASSYFVLHYLNLETF